MRKSTFYLFIILSLCCVSFASKCKIRHAKAESTASCWANKNPTRLLKAKRQKQARASNRYGSYNVQRLSTPIRPSSMCNKAPVPSAHQTQGVTGFDLVIYVSTQYVPNENFLAWASFCLKDGLNGRPTAGQVNWNTYYLRKERTKFEEQIDTGVHEILHILVFHPNLYQEYRVAFGSNEVRPVSSTILKKTIRGKEVWAIKTPKLLEVSRDYFKCSSIDSVLLEDDGGSGSQGAHWEKRVVHNEMMGPSNSEDAAFSAFTLALLEDSGWYKVDWRYAEPLYFGKDAGCSFLESCSPSSTIREWCTEGQMSCTFSYKGYGQCRRDPSLQDCPYFQSYEDARCEDETDNLGGNAAGQTYAIGSRCVIGNAAHQDYLTTGEDGPRCLKYTCEENGRVIRFQFSAGGEAVCRTPGERAQASSPYEGSILCPDPAPYCSSKMYPGCSNLCSRNGYCNNGVCECNTGWGGSDCSIRGGASPVPSGSGTAPSGSDTSPSGSDTAPSGSDETSPDSDSTTTEPSGTGSTQRGLWKSIWDGNWGDWNLEKSFSMGLRPCGLSIRLDIPAPPPSQYDETAMNGISFRLCQISDWNSQRDERIEEGLTGTWLNVVRCRTNHHITELRVRYQSPQGTRRDDTALNNIQIKCSDGQEIDAAQAYANSLFGDWRSWVSIKGGICGAQTRLEKFQGKAADNTALNGIKVLECER